MFIYTIRRLNLFLITMAILTMVGFSILRLDQSSLWSNQPFWGGGWFTYIDNLLMGNLGLNRHGSPVLLDVLTVFPATLELCFFAFTLSLLAGHPVGNTGWCKTRGDLSILQSHPSLWSVTLFRSSGWQCCLSCSFRSNLAGSRLQAATAYSMR